MSRAFIRHVSMVLIAIISGELCVILSPNIKRKSIAAVLAECANINKCEIIRVWQEYGDKTGGLYFPAYSPQSLVCASK